MRVRTLVSCVAVGVLGGFAAVAGEARDPEPEGMTVEDALAEPSDPDDEANIRADDDPEDVGQEGLEATKSGAPPSSPGSDGDPGRE